MQGSHGGHSPEHPGRPPFRAQTRVPTATAGGGSPSAPRDPRSPLTSPPATRGLFPSQTAPAASLGPPFGHGEGWPCRSWHLQFCLHLIARGWQGSTAVGRCPTHLCHLLWTCSVHKGCGGGRVGVAVLQVHKMQLSLLTLQESSGLSGHLGTNGPQVGGGGQVPPGVLGQLLLMPTLCRNWQGRRS